MLAMLLPNPFMFFYVFLSLLALGMLDFSSNMLCRISSPALKLSFDPSSIIICILVLNEVTQVHKALSKALLFLSFEGIIPFLDIGKALLNFDIFPW